MGKFVASNFARVAISRFILALPLHSQMGIANRALGACRMSPITFSWSVLTGVSVPSRPTHSGITALFMTYSIASTFNFKGTIQEKTRAVTQAISRTMMPF
jgi:hypothetical protein